MDSDTVTGKPFTLPSRPLELKLALMFYSRTCLPFRRESQTVVLGMPPQRQRDQRSCLRASSLRSCNDVRYSDRVVLASFGGRRLSGPQYHAADGAPGSYARVRSAILNSSNQSFRSLRTACTCDIASRITSHGLLGFTRQFLVVSSKATYP